MMTNEEVFARAYEIVCRAHKLADNACLLQEQPAFRADIVRAACAVMLVDALQEIDASLEHIEFNQREER